MVKNKSLRVREKEALVIIFITLSLMMIAIIFCPKAAAEGEGVTNAITALQKSFPNGKYWNHLRQVSSDDGDALKDSWNNSYGDYISSTPCATHNGLAGIGSYDCNAFDGCIQCYGFANRIYYAVFGEHCYKTAKRTDVQNIMPGDHVRFTTWGNDGHSAIVWKRNGDTLTLLECNYGAKCIISWGRDVNISSSNIVGFYHASNWNDINSKHNIVSATFSSWNNDKYTYITETDASLGQVITVTGGSCTETGIYITDLSDNVLASAKNDGYNASVPQIYFQVNSECHYTLAPGTTYKYRFYAVVDGAYYWSGEQFFTTQGSTVKVEFSPWSKQGYTYVTERDASIGSLITVAGGKCTETGIHLFDSNGMRLAQAKNDSYVESVPQIYFMINAEANCLLSAETMYKYRFYAIVDGKTYYDEYRSFTTAPHSFGDWTIEIDPTCTGEGLKSRVCSGCGERDYANLPAKGHAAVTDAAVAATCTEAGKTEGSHCSVCGEVIKEQTTVEALGHDGGEWVVVKEATSSDEGLKELRCNRCGEVIDTRTIPKVSKPIDDNVSAPSVKTVNAKKGESVTVNVYVNSNGKANQVRVSFSYDTSVFEFVEASTTISGVAGTSTLVVYDLNKPVDGVIGTITLKVKDDVKDGAYTISASIADIEDAIDNNGDEVGCKAAVDKVSVASKKPGDLNDDGKVNLKDSMLLLQHLAGWDVTFNKTNADINGDGVVNLKDSMLLLQYLAGWESAYI